MFNDFFNKNLDDSPFLQCNREVFSRKQFIESVDFVCNELGGTSEISSEDFVFIKEENPFWFFSILIALWRKGYNVHFPNKQYLENDNTPEVCKYSIEYKNSIRICQNDHFHEVDLPHGGDSIVFSSGSTGKPKGILHSKEAFVFNAIDTAFHMNMEEFESLTFLKPYLVSSLSHFLVHWYLNSLLIFDDIKELSNLCQYRDYYSLNIVGSPIHIVQSIQYLSKASIVPRCFFSSGDIIASSVIEKILNEFPRTVFFKAYGLAEVGGRLFVSKITKNTDNKDALGCALSSYDFKLVEGEMVVSSNNLFLGYLLEGNFAIHNGWFYTGDKVEASYGVLRILGRLDDEVKVAGNKVSLKSLEERVLNALNNDFNIFFAIIVAVPHSLFGNTLSLVIDAKIIKTQAEIFSSLRFNNIKNYELPHHVFIIKDVPLTQTMKVDRKAIQLEIQNGNLESLL